MDMFIIDALSDAPAADWLPVGVMFLQRPMNCTKWWKASLPLIKWLRLWSFRPDGNTLIRFGVYDKSGACVSSMTWRTDASEIPAIEAAAGLTEWDGVDVAKLIDK